MITDLPSHRDEALFLTTRWTRVRLAKADSAAGRLALAELCEAYYEPVLAYLRYELRDVDAGRELSHAFFAEVLRGGRIEGADQERGRFRSYLLGAVKHFLSRHREALHSLKRGSGRVPLCMDDAEVAEVSDPHQLSPDAAFDRQWALTMLERSLNALRLQLNAEGRGPFFDRVRPMLTGEAAHGDQASIASECSMTVETFRVALHRLKRRLRQCVKEEISGTLEDDTNLEDEMQTLFAALSG
ncbi:RNA polymerase sigma-70 factor, ECF subfamily [Prosthecobacter debontii]|uniref:RNA polymerase sigma-70 factor, ECF subfamily n=1 Tax=Prosthecobacter debontii TaxID=48467 RepID=A0A1T4XQL9_9BACT|nr:sigma-70 family RNA polymerase sigma factor [Prosthecobacter debontii]SKA91849.1 RNA polymerase sigma-70 factor, ECF subfamily [Prosthecobacter debontii]